MARTLLFTSMLMLCSSAASAQAVQATGTVVVQVQPVAPPPVYVETAPAPQPVYVQPPPVSGPVYLQPVQQQPVYVGRRGRMRAERYDGGPIPPGARIFRRRSGGLIALGVIAFVPAYAISALYGFILSNTYSRYAGSASLFYIPVVGAAIGGFALDSSVGGYGPNTVFGVIDSIAQIAGVASFFFGMRGHDFVEYVAGNEPRPAHRAQWMLTPATSPTYAGLNLTVFNL